MGPTRKSLIKQRVAGKIETTIYAKFKHKGTLIKSPRLGPHIFLMMPFGQRRDSRNKSPTHIGCWLGKGLNVQAVQKEHEYVLQKILFPAQILETFDQVKWTWLDIEGSGWILVGPTQPCGGCGFAKITFQFQERVWTNCSSDCDQSGLLFSFYNKSYNSIHSMILIKS